MYDLCSAMGYHTWFNAPVTILKFVMIFEHRFSCFHFAPDPTNYITIITYEDPLAWLLLPSPFSFPPDSSFTLQTAVTLILHQFLEVVPAFAQPIPPAWNTTPHNTNSVLCSANFFLSSRSSHNYLLRDTFSDLPGLSIRNAS